MRTMLKPRWLAFLGLVIGVVVAFAVLGLWQLDVARDQGAKDALAQAQSQPAAPIDQVLEPHTEFQGVLSNRKVTLTGHYVASGQVLVTPRVLDGTRGYWVITPFQVDSSGAWIAVLRGFVTDPAQATAVPATRTTVSGTLAPGDSPVDLATPPPPGQLASVDLGQLVNVWTGAELYNAFVFATGESPDLTATITPAAKRVPPPAMPDQLSWRNFAYALQWWVFAAFAVYIWWKTVRDDYHDSLAARAGPDEDPDDEARDEPGDPDDEDRDAPGDPSEHPAAADQSTTDQGAPSHA
nr:SURF1 family protein [Arsenicicoccus piscis]